MAGHRPVNRGFVSYNAVNSRFMNGRRLRRYAGVWSLWALGVGAVISGDFFGWNFGLATAGIGGMAIATAIVAVMYVCLCYSLAEMSPAMPHTGGAYSFARTAFGPSAGFITGVAEVIEYVLTPAVIVVGIGGYIGAAVNSLLGIDVAAPAWWLVFYVAFVGINIAGVGATFRVAFVLTFLALGCLALFWIDWAFRFRWDMALATLPGSANSDWLPRGWFGVAQALPFAIWFFLAIEQLPLAAEESRRPGADMPRALRWGILTLIVTAAITLLLASGLPRGWASIEDVDRATGTLFGIGVHPAVPALMFVGGFAASFHAIIYAYGRRIFGLSRSGYLPYWLSLTHSRTRTPHLALIGGAAIGYSVALLIEFGEEWLGSDVPVGAVLLNMAVFGAVIAYIMQMASFVRLRRRYPGLYRPYTSLLGSAGAVMAGLIACATLVFLFVNVDYRMGLYGCGVFFAAALLYFVLFGRRRLVISPEENFALRLEEEENAG
ncbi:MAG: amino acid permease [Chloroflexi bacterium]|nr:amino acid permease [Chloroflexota bacterium]